MSRTAGPREATARLARGVVGPARKVLRSAARKAENGTPAPRDLRADECEGQGIVTERSGEPDIRLGSGGWRGVVGREVTPARSDALAAAAAASLCEAGPGPLVVAWDSRPESVSLAQRAARHLARTGIAVEVPGAPCPTPVVTHWLARGGRCGALVFTASHNPAEYAGIKVFDARGCPVESETARAIGDRATALVGSEAAVCRPDATPTECDPVAAYRTGLLERLDVEAIGRAAPHVHYDALHGTGAGVLDAVLGQAGARVDGHALDPDPTFGGAAPDPVPPRLAALGAAVAADGGTSFGVATDGDADRFAVVDEDGRALSATQSLALVIDHLGATGRLGSVGLARASGSLVERVAASHGVAVRRATPGFHHLAGMLCRGEVAVAGDESGGFADGGLSCDKDGMLAGALVVERVAREGRLPGAALRALETRHGASACGRSTVADTPVSRDALAKRAGDPPDRVGGIRVREACAEDGLYLAFEDGFLMLRRSATEPVIRVFAEATDDASLAQRLAHGRALLGARDA